MRLNSLISSSNGHDRASWRVLLLLVLAVLLPTACVLWFINTAVGNERLLVRQRLTDAYKANLALVRDRVSQSWERRLKDLEQVARENASPAAFARVLSRDLADAAVLFDAHGRLVYPAPAPQPADIVLHRQAWDQAAELEYNRRNLASAARAYRHIAATAADVREAARAVAAESRCLLRAGNKQAVVELVRREFASPRFQQAVDAAGRLVAVDQELLAVQILGAQTAGPLLARLQARLSDYGNPTLHSDQRRFAMSELRALGVSIPSLAAEELAARWVEQVLPKQFTREMFLRRCLPEGVWQVATADGRMVALYRTESIERRIRESFAGQPLPPGVATRVLDPAAPAAGSIDSAAISDRLPGWRLAVHLSDREMLDAEAQQHITTYVWIGVLVVAAICILTFLAMRALRRQMKVASLKNDLVATVSHELKTPLASMRLLVDTLLDAEDWDRTRVREYLEMIASENSRLSRLIDNFLTFSRMERNKHRFEFREVTAEEVVHSATAALGDRLRPPACRFDLDLTPQLPPISADPDSVVTVIVNLLDNACKYTEADRRIRLRAFSDNGHVCFAVEDNGIGLQAKDRKRIFDRFYQVDQRMTRRTGGCGLGLSIVNYIVQAHGGHVDVESEPGRGSTFVVHFPAQASRS